MNWLDRAENKFGHLAFTGLPWAIAVLNFLVWAMCQMDPNYYAYLNLQPARIMEGEVWRLFTFIFIPSFFGPGPLHLLGLILYLLFIIFVGNTLEQSMGAFRLNVYYLLGMIGVIAASFIARSGAWGNPILNSSLFFAMAWYVPDAVIYIMYIIPVKVRWAAWIGFAFLAFQFILGPWAVRLGLVAALINYIIFFGPEILQMSRERAGVADRRGRFQREVQAGQSQSLHECHVCHRTEVDSPHLEFRVARDGEEYCLEHIPKPAAQG